MLFLKSLMLLPALLLMLLTSPLQAQEQLIGKIKLCSTESDNSKRLSCYDSIAKMLSHNTNGQWQADTTPSLLSNGLNIELTLDSNEPVKSRTQTVRPRLQLSCTDSKSTVSVHWGVYLGKNRSKMLTRIGQQAPVEQHWHIGNDSHAVYYLGDTDKFIQQLNNNTTLVAQISPYNADPIIATFNITGLSTAIPSMPLSCNW
ncbi:MAG: type VI secretion system-associated protein TagO [Spongiibacteraceae bacterium]